jgi:hypothetical protein
MTDSKKRDEAAASDAAIETTDPAILKLLDFEPVERRHKRPDGWTPALQRIFIARLASLGSVNAATEALGKNRYGVEKLYKSAGADGFRAAWDRAIALFEEREAQRIARENAALAGVKPPFVDRRKTAPSPGSPEASPTSPSRGEVPVLPVICDNCRQTGLPGEGSFSEIRDLFDFDPVPRAAHDNLWPAETQRAFIAALAVSGSVVRGARSVGRHAFGAEKLRKARGSRSFNEAWEAALDLARERELTRLHGKLDDLAQSPPPLAGREEGADGEPGDQDVEEARERLFDKLERLRKQELLKHKDDPKWRAAWEVVNGPEDWAGLEDGTWQAASWREAGSGSTENSEQPRSGTSAIRENEHRSDPGIVTRR